jgi:hypothetical protein
MEANEKNQILFTQLVLMFHGAAMQQMGKVKNPLTDKVERDLGQAQLSIDMLEMIRTKMKGNLTAEEERLIDTLLRELRLNYVDEVSKDRQKPEEKPASPTGSQ